MNAASPIVKLGKMMWNEIVSANWMRASRRASNSMGGCRRRWLGEERVFCRPLHAPSSNWSHPIVTVHRKRNVWRARMSVRRELRERSGPEPHHAVGARGDEVLPIRRKGNRGRASRVATQGAQDAPHAHRAVLTRRGEQVLPRREGHIRYAALVAGERAHAARGVDRPHV